MTNLYILLSISLLLSGIFLISIYNPIYKILFLILLFFFGSSLFLILDFYFLGLTYFIVYIGAITILFLFVIMMVQLTITDSDNLLDNKNNLNIITKADNLNIINNSFNNPYILLELLRSDNLKSSINNHTSSINIEFNKINPNILIYIGMTFISSILILFSLNNFIGYDYIYNYFYNEWSLLYITFTDIELLGYLIYVSYPLTLIIISYLLWLILIGILSVTI